MTVIQPITQKPAGFVTVPTPQHQNSHQFQMSNSLSPTKHSYQPLQDERVQFNRTGGFIHVDKGMADV